MFQKLGRGLVRTANSIFVLMLLPVLFLAAFGFYVDTPFVANLGDAGYLLLLILATLFVLLLLTFFCHAIDRLTDNGVRLLTALMFVAMAFGMAVMILNFNAIDRLDAFYVIDKARWLADNPGEVVSIKQIYGEYYSRYPNNHLLVAFFANCFKLLDRFGVQNQYRALAIFNSACIYLANVSAYRIAHKCKGSRFAAKALVLLTLNPLSYILTYYVYSTTLSIPLLMGIVDLGLDAFRSKRKVVRYLASLLCGILGALSYFVRPTSMMPLVAFFLLAVIYVLCHRERLAEVLRLAATCAVGLAVAVAVIPLTYNGYFDHDLDGNSFPVSHWIMMGSHGNGRYSSEDARITAALETKEEKNQVAIETIVRNYRQLGPSGTLRHFVNKLGVTFASGYPEDKLSMDTVHSALYPYIADDRNDLFRIFCHAFRLATLLLMLAGGIEHFLDRDDIDPMQLICSFSVMGGFIFYALWEVKTIYGAPFAPCMLLCASSGMPLLAQASRAPLARIEQKGMLRQSFALMTAALCLLSLLLYGPFSQYYYERTDYAWRRVVSHLNNVGIDELQEQDAVIVQELPLDRPINTIELQSYRPEEEGTPSLYRLDLTDDSGNVLKSVEFTSEDEHDWMVTVPMEYAPEQPMNAKVVLTVLRAGDSPLHFFFRRSAVIKAMPGETTLNGESFPYSLELSAYYRYQAPYLRTRWYALLCAGLYGMVTVLLVGCWKLGSQGTPDAAPDAGEATLLY